MELPGHWPSFFTATNLNWLPLLQPSKYKDIIINSLSFLVKNKRAEVSAFVIMQNHIHLIWQILPGHTPQAVQRDFLKFTGQQIKSDLLANNPSFLASFRVGAKDRAYQFWERNSLGIDLRTRAVFEQKLDYIHHNPVKAGLCQLPEEYHYSSAAFYQTGIDRFSFLSHWQR